jgi:hypothetical protein
MISPLRLPARLALRLWLPALAPSALLLAEEVGEDVFNIGPLNIFFFLLAKTNPPVLLDPKPKLELPQTPSLKEDTGACRTTRILDGKVPVVGVAGRTFTEWWGLLVGIETLLIDPEPFEEVEEALEWLWWWWWMLRTEETEEEVDLRPLRPALDRRKADRGVNGEGEIDCLLLGVV